ncbi:RNA polymerase sigma factor [Streptomonospora nanhaiensis]|uniref:RNA polymerase sigma-70 factor (ECF subfamily) n=1 Tax=Streptomonospora nanhaiensis TaxID=1323731 RepID=A0A853BKC2_9ACTN|nr:sigma-70 family RNA polymerase sigma factor [Streptomonospora nanhaiensis]MBV2363338.1 sigma-70 family RNA polymerase sigma factor [Streptomonospora nanhaiensis]MBX9388521.1 sigma-70 family RNA polymerase sigma factor [Streptomonospora nanhaiensis]NYI95703.1 RNA polymerase sigma-70 factor (ECF subfamily) [Streptomonospora nanhaiensis]
MTNDRDEESGSRAAGEFTRFFELHYDAVYRYALRRVGPDHADDVASEAFGVAWARFDRVPRQSPLPWLYTVARNIVLARGRRARRRGELPDAFDGPWPHAPAEPDVTAQVLDRQAALSALNRLKPKDRELVMLLAWEGLDLPTAAGVLGCTAATARVRLYRARRRIERLLGEGGAAATPRNHHLVSQEGPK